MISDETKELAKLTAKIIAVYVVVLGLVHLVV